MQTLTYELVPLNSGIADFRRRHASEVINIILSRMLFPRQKQKTSRGDEK